jgi:ABC-type multidrug transport system permease subunit
MRNKKSKRGGKGKNSVARSIILGLVIAVVFLLFSVYGTKLIFKEIEYSDFCDDYFYEQPRTVYKNCSYNESLNSLRQECYRNKENAVSIYDAEGCEVGIRCDPCQREFEDAQENRSKSMFIITLIFSLIVIAISAFLIPVESVSGGLMFGSLMFIIYGTGSYWRYMDDWLRFIVLGAALGALIFIGYKLSRRK